MLTVLRIHDPLIPKHGAWRCNAANDAAMAAAEIGSMDPYDPPSPWNDGIRMEKWHSDYVCGFKDLRQLCQWFPSPHVRRALFHRAVVSEWDVTDARLLEGTHWQVAFVLHLATQVRILDPEEVINPCFQSLTERSLETLLRSSPEPSF